jgi:hypothetical protein
VSFSLPYMICRFPLEPSCLSKMLPTGIKLHFVCTRRAKLILYNKTLLNCFPGNCRTIPRISKSKSVARTSLEFKPLVSTRSSICRDSSALNSS